MHWTRLAIVGCAGISLITCFMPWLLEVPRPEGGTRTLYGIQTTSGIMVALMAAAQIGIAFVDRRDVRPHRGLLAALMFLSLMMIGTASLQLGDQDYELGFGGVVLILGVFPSLIVPFIAMFIRREPPLGWSHQNTWTVDPNNPYAPPRWDQGPPNPPYP